MIKKMTKKRVLLACDDAALTSRLAKGLPHLELTILRDADAAVLAVRESVFDALVVSLRMGRTLNGARVLDARRARCSRMPAFVLCEQVEAEIFASIQRLDAVPIPTRGLTAEVLGRLIEEPPLGAWLVRDAILRVLLRCGFTFDETHDLALRVLVLAVEEIGSISGAATALGMKRQRAQDVLKRQVPLLPEHS